MAIAGRSNVGKSSLINALLGVQHKGLARTSSTPGRTRQLNFYLVNERFVLVDLPGYGFAVGPEAERLSWGPLVEGYLRTRETLRGVLLVMDVRRDPEDEERELLAFLRATGRPAAVAVTKLDKLRRGAAYAKVAAIRRELGVPAVGVSSRLGTGRDELWRLLRGWLDAPPPLGQNEPSG